MEFHDTPEMAAFRTEVRGFLASETPDLFRRRSAEDTSLRERRGGGPELMEAMQDWRKTVARKGWIAPAWPQDLGGAGMGVLEQFVMNQEFAEHRIPHPGGMGVMMAGPTIIAHGTDDQKQEHLSRILSGETVWCQGFSEPGSGSDLASLQTRAVRDGDDYVLNGQKIWTSGAHMANWMFALVRTDPDAPKHRGISYLLFPMDSPGVSVRPLVQMTGEASFNEVFFEDVRVPVRNRIGEENRGWYVGVTTLDFERSGIGSAVGVTQSAERMAQFAKELGVLRERPRLRYEIADRVVEANVLTLLSYRVITMQAQGMIPNYEASAAKLYSSELNQRMAATDLKIGGLFSQIYDRKSPHERARRGAMAYNYMATVPSTIAGGTSEVQRNIVATRGLGLPRG
jgi:alkylation response protein AidB-like acyl-CoA dehydrogenase